MGEKPCSVAGVPASVARARQNGGATSYGQQMAAVHGPKKRRPEYGSWRAAMRRCHDESHDDFPEYGGRGVFMADEWRMTDGFWRFFEHVGPRPSPRHSIDRVDNLGHYVPGNVRWATAKEQANNRRPRRLRKILPRAVAEAVA